MKKFIIFLFMFALIATQGICAEKTIKITNPPWPPYYSESLPGYGVVPEIISAAYERKGYKVEYSFMTLLSKLFEDIKKGEYDAAATAYYTEERAKEYFFSDSYMESPVVFYKRKGEPVSWKTMDDLKNYKIAVLRGNSYSPEFDKADFLKKTVTVSEKLSFRKLYLKEADLAVMDQIVGYYLINNELPDYQKDAFELVQPALHVNRLYLMFSKNALEIQQKIDAFNSGLKEISKDGTLKKILSKHGF